MTKLNADILIERLQRRISELNAGAEIANKDIRALLTDTQQQSLDAALAAQAELKKAKRARTDEEKAALGWKTIREVRLEVLKDALAEAHKGIADDFERRQRANKVRQGRIYFDSIKKALAEGKDIHSAKSWANNELTRAGLGRFDEIKVPLRLRQHDGPRTRTQRDIDVEAMEAVLRERMIAAMTDEEREQWEMLEESNKFRSK